MEDTIIDRLIECLPTHKSHGEYYNILVRAFKLCDVEVLKSFINMGVSPNITLFDGHSPLTLVIDTASSDNWQNVATLLLNSGANPNMCNPKGKSILSMLVTAGESELVELAIRKGAKIECPFPSVENAVITAVHFKKVSCLKVLLEHGANPNAISNEGSTALMWAAGRSNGIGSQKCLAAVKALLAYGADPSICNHRGYTPLMAAALIREATTVQVLIEAGAQLEATDFRGETALFKAVYSNCVESVKHLLMAGANVNARCKNERTSLMVGNSFKIFNLLLKFKSDPSATDMDGFTALHHYARADKPHFLRILCIHGSSLESTCKLGNTPLQIAVRARSTASIKFFMDRGANVSTRNNSGVTLFHESIIPWDYFRTLDVFPIVNTLSMLHEVQGYVTPASDACTDLIREMLSSGGSCDEATKCGVTPLMLAALCGDVALCTLLIKEGNCDPHAEDCRGRNVLCYACRGGQTCVVKLLGRYNVEVNCLDCDYNLPIFYAAQFQFMNIVNLFILDFAFFMCYSINKQKHI